MKYPLDQFNYCVPRKQSKEKVKCLLALLHFFVTFNVIFSFFVFFFPFSLECFLHKVVQRALVKVRERGSCTVHSTKSRLRLTDACENIISLSNRVMRHLHSKGERPFSRKNETS